MVRPYAPERLGILQPSACAVCRQMTAMNTVETDKAITDRLSLFGIVLVLVWRPKAGSEFLVRHKPDHLLNYQKTAVNIHLFHRFIPCENRFYSSADWGETKVKR